MREFLWVETFADQVRAVAEGGADAIIIEILWMRLPWRHYFLSGLSLESCPGLERPARPPLTLSALFLNERSNNMTNTMRRELTAKLVGLGRPFSYSLRIELASLSSHEIFKWFLASILFGARIFEQLAARTYMYCQRQVYHISIG
ncbi:hypothetical protein HKBW3S42_01257 [Candidatus Hakubella thermalkaliphila]|uniref:Uncharacterized protein n=1 Tax=Candidatus Hakubella thermalkaliphila TaxID=2754717 RepID=A0A6V8PL08_9ACTN|nr:hypothetical protein HKBW3S42_01257 [Candidatus Hakubella thermalkaliphila]